MTRIASDALGALIAAQARELGAGKCEDVAGQDPARLVIPPVARSDNTASRARALGQYETVRRSTYG